MQTFLEGKTMTKQRGRGGMGASKHRKSGKSPKPSGVMKATAEFFNKESGRRRRKQKMHSSVKALIEESKQ